MSNWISGGTRPECGLVFTGTGVGNLAGNRSSIGCAGGGLHPPGRRQEAIQGRILNHIIIVSESVPASGLSFFLPILWRKRLPFSPTPPPPPLHLTPLPSRLFLCQSSRGLELGWGIQECARCGSSRLPNSTSSTTSCGPLQLTTRPSEDLSRLLPALSLPFQPVT